MLPEVRTHRDGMGRQFSANACHARRFTPIEEMFDHPQVVAEELVTTLDHPVVGPYRTMTKPVKFSGTPGAAPTAAPTFGQHSEEILAAHGYSAADIATLRERGVVR